MCILGGGANIMWMGCASDGLTAAQDQRTRLPVHRKVAQLHRTGRFDGEPVDRANVGLDDTYWTGRLH